MEDEHRVFLQGIMSKGILNSGEVTALFKIACQRCSVSFPENPKEQNEKLLTLIHEINKGLKDLNFEIVKVLDEDSSMKKCFYAFVNRMDRSGDSTQLTKKAMVKYPVHELEYLKLLVEAVIESEEREVSNIVAINLARNIKAKAVKSQEGEAIIGKFVEDLWLRKTRPDGSIRLAPRFLAEMEPYLKDVHGAEIKKCTACKKMVVRGVPCRFCPAGTVTYHLYCLAAKRSNDGDESVSCQCCKNKIEVAPHQSDGKRKRAIEITSDSD